MDNVHSFDEFLERKLPQSGRKAYYLRAIHEQLPRMHKVELQQVGWPKATELAKSRKTEDPHEISCLSEVENVGLARKTGFGLT